ncbi:MAG: hypothetical protein LBG72_08755 [Spirochaetaceae bacterium]|jgi:hypothetical protein|nr:hypothetical protein [Spirochaetaceae bacterium]
MNRKKPSIFAAFLVLSGTLFTCGNPMIQDEYERIGGMGDTKTYSIASPEDVKKIETHPDGTFLITSDEDLELSAPIADFRGRIQGAGNGKLLVSGMFCLKANGASFRDITFKQNGSVPRGQAIIGMVAGEAVDTSFINVKLEGALSSNRTGDENVIIGAIAGKVDGASTIERCASFSDVTISVSAAQTIKAGGIVGLLNGGSIKYSYSHSAINLVATSTIEAGGFTAENRGEITDSYYASGTGLSGSQMDNAPAQLFSYTALNIGTIKNSYSHANGTNERWGQTSAGTNDNCLDQQGGSTSSYLSSDATYATFISSNPESQWILAGMTSSGPFARLINNPDSLASGW